VLQWIADAFRQTAHNGIHGQPDVSPMYTKMGWTGATYLATQPMLYQFGMAGVFGKWLDDIRLSQAATGEIPTIAPLGNVWDGDLLAPAYTGVYPYLVRRYWLTYGDPTVPQKHFDAVRRYLEWLLSQFPDDIADDWFGDWYPPKPPRYPRGREGGKLVGTAYVIQSLRDATALAELLGHVELARAWRNREDRIVARFNDTFLDTGAGHYRTSVEAGYRQASNAIPLALGLVPAQHVDSVAANLAADVEAKDRHLDTGSVGTSALPFALSDHGRADLALAVLEQRSYPSYGYLRDLGATTFWESWEPTSRGHNDTTISSPVRWLVERVLGVELLRPGWARFRIAPRAFGDLPGASVTLDTVRGRIDVAWRRKGNALILDARIPVNAVAELTLPNGRQHELGSGTYNFVTPLG
jgi:alpha-L-rhamnosidase